MRNQPGRESAAVNVFRAVVGSRSPQELDLNLAALARTRAELPESAPLIDQMFAEELGRLRNGLEAAQAAQTGIRAEIEELLSPPYFPAVFLGRTGGAPEAQALVRTGGELRAVTFGDHNPDDFQDGDSVLLSRERNFIYSKVQGGALTCGETAAFVAWTKERRLIIKSREEELVVLAAQPLRDAGLKAGDLIRFDRVNWVAHEKIERPRGDEYFLEETPSETFADIGGLDKEIEELKRTIELHFRHPDTVSKYRLRRKKSVLLHGSPGTGKTLIARALANHLASHSTTDRSRFINIKPSALHSMWYAQSQANYRDVFRVAREAGARDPEVPVVMFFDEVDSIGRVRGHSIHHIDDSVLNAFMSELNGLEDRGNVLVVSATNRLDTLDSALTRPGRLGDLIVRIPRPDRKSARQIFERHLPAEVPYAGDSRDAGSIRTELIDAAVAKIFAADAASELAHIMFRDGKRRAVRASDLLNGAGIAAMAGSAIERACVREARGGDGGVQLADVLAGVGDYFQSAASALTPHNCHNYLDDLPQDADVVRVDPVVRKVNKPYRYVTAA